MLEKVCVALGGNAILKYTDRGTAEEQFENVRRTAKYLVRMIKEGYKIIITHGNGPQIGDILIRNERCADILPPMTLDVLGAESQGMIGYMIQQAMWNELRREGLNIPVITFVTQVLVDKNDPAFGNPEKFVGPFYTHWEAEKLMDERGWILRDDAGRGFRRVVPSPKPKSIVEIDTIKRLYGEGVVVIAAGGGGIPVFEKEDGSLQGVEAVIDKDLTGERLATSIGAETFLILTNIEGVAINFRKPNQKFLKEMSIVQAREYLEQGQFERGSMKPKIEAAMKFVTNGGKKVIISLLELGEKALKGEAGTLIHV
ncbi:MAG: carbamate kinase [Candidatus Jordarchaeum sp.]|uniref:carbamate kinase n=1 Tax=Candidatus Jordarchaeum sp. TaxID=2823881 RepID=UPI0040496C16